MATYPPQLLFGHTGGHIVEVQHAGWGLDDVLRGLASTHESVVAGHGKVLVAAGTVLQLKHLAWDDGLLLGHTAEEEKTDTCPY